MILQKKKLQFEKVLHLLGGLPLTHSENVEKIIVNNEKSQLQIKVEKRQILSVSIDTLIKPIKTLRRN